jgi:hypothetical protein
MQGLARLSSILQQGLDRGEFHVDDLFLTSMGIARLILRVANWYSGNEAAPLPRRPPSIRST